jgi:hypothetical protein
MFACLAVLKFKIHQASKHFVHQFQFLTVWKMFACLAVLKFKIPQASKHFVHHQKIKLLVSISYSVLPSAYCLVTFPFLSSNLPPRRQKVKSS